MKKTTVASLVIFGFLFATTWLSGPSVCLGFKFDSGGKKIAKDIFGLNKPEEEKGLNGTYKLNKRSYTASNLKIKRIIVTDDETVVHFKYTNYKGNKFAKGVASGGGIGIYLAGHKGAFRIVSTDGKKRYLLTDSSGIGIRPDGTNIPIDKSKEFTITFPRIDDSMNRFHLMEGNVKNAWHFMNVSLGETRAEDDDLNSWGEIINEIMEKQKQ